LLRQNVQGAGAQNAAVPPPPWVLRSKSAALLALVIKRSGPEFLKTGLAQLIDDAQSSPFFQEAACLVLKYLADEIIQFIDDLAGDQLRQLITTLSSILGPVLQFVERTIETNFVLITPEKPKSEVAPHIAAVHAALGVAEVYSEWAPVGTLRDSGIVNACGFLLRNNHEFKIPACQVLLKLAGRKLTADENVDLFNAAMLEAGDALMQTANTLLAAENNPAIELDYEGDNDEFGLLVCDAMAVLGSGHLQQAAPVDGGGNRRMLFLQYMLAFAQHPYLLLADKALGMWSKLLQDAALMAQAQAGSSADDVINTNNEGNNNTSTSDTSNQASGGGGEQGSHAREAPLPPEAVVALMELAAEHLQNRNPHVPQAEDDVPLYFDSFEDYKEFMIGYRLKLSSIVKAAAVVLPQQALQAAATRLNAAIAAAAAVGATTTPTPALEQARVVFEAAVVFTMSANKAVWDATAAFSNENERAARTAAIVTATEPMLHSLLALHVTDPALLQSQARGLEAFSRLIAVRSDILPTVVTRVFELMTNCVPLEPQGDIQPPVNPPPGWREGLQARSDAAAVLLEYSKAAPQAFLPHLDGIGQRLNELWELRQLRPGERNAITEALLGASQAGSLELQTSLTEWALAPVRAEWASPEFQGYVASPQAFLAYYVPVTVDSSAPGGVRIGCQAGRWALYHQVHMVERAIRRLQHSTVPAAQHPLVPHMSWIVPTLLQLISNLNAVHTTAGRGALGAAANAVEMSPQERALYLRRGPAAPRRVVAAAVAGAAAAAAAGGSQQIAGAPIQPTAGADAGDTGDYASVGGTTLGSLRAWLRHLREFSYHSLGLLPTCVPATLENPALPVAFASSTLAYIDALNHQHVRLVLRHVTIPYVKATPAHLMHSWVLPQLALLAPHMQHRLAAAWAVLLAQTSTDALPPSSSFAGGNQSSSSIAGGDAQGGAANDEIINERMVRELTQEYSDLLREIAARVLEDPNHIGASAGGGGVDGSAPVNTALTAANVSIGNSSSAAGMGKSSKANTTGTTFLELLLEREPAAGIAAASAAVQGMQLPDEAAYRFAMFNRALVALAPRDSQLYAYVGSEVLRSAITSLASEIMSTHQADILGLIRNILAQQLADTNSAVHGVLRSLPGVTPEKEAAFAEAFQKTGSEKDQRNIFKKFLVEACGRTNFAALAEWRPPSVLPAGALRNRGGRAAAAAAAAGGSGASGVGEAAAEEQLQGDITRALFA
jgi:exportin-5